MKKILCLCLSPTIQRTLYFEDLKMQNVNRSKFYIENASGKAVNSSRVLNQIKKNCSSVICPIGKKNSFRFMSLCKKDGLKIIPLKIPGLVRECWTLVGKKNSSTTEIVCDENFSDLDFKNEEKKLLKIIKNQIKKYDAFLFAGSKPKYFSENLILEIAKIVKLSKKIFMADFWGPSLFKAIEGAIPEIIKINENEFIGTFSENLLSEEDLKSLVIQKSAVLNNIIVVTRGEKSTFAGVKGKFFEEPSRNCKKIVNTTACGDSFNSGFLYEFLKSKNIEKALKKGTKCASLNAESLVPGSLYPFLED